MYIHIIFNTLKPIIISETNIAVTGMITALNLFLKYTPAKIEIAIMAVKFGKSFILGIFTTLEIIPKKTTNVITIIGVLDLLLIIIY